MAWTMLYGFHLLFFKLFSSEYLLLFLYMYLLLSSFSHRYTIYSSTILLLHDECCFFYIFFIHYNLVVSRKAIDTILKLILSTIVDEYVDIRQGKITFWNHFVEILIIYAYPEFSIFLWQWNNVINPSGILGHCDDL